MAHKALAILTIILGASLSIAYLYYAPSHLALTLADPPPTPYSNNITAIYVTLITIEIHAADTGDRCHGKPHYNTLDTKTPRHNSITTRQIHRTQVLCQPSNNHHQRHQQHIHDPQREPDRNQGTSHRRRLPHLWRRNDDSPAGPVVQQQRDHEQPNHDSDASRNSQTSVEGGRARGSTRAYEGSTWPWCLRASLKLIFYKKIDYQPGLTASMVFIVFSRVGIRPGPGSRGDAPMPGGRACVLRRTSFRSIRTVCSALSLCRTCRTLSFRPGLN